jgi:diguanylate cyclase (GGDEF)-like protein
MSVVQEGPGIKARANFLACEALSAQLCLLQAFLPLDGWLVGRQDGEHCTVVAASGIFDDCAPACLAALLHGNWRSADGGRGIFQSRAVNSAEALHLAPALAGGTSAQYLVKARLQCPAGLTVGHVIGVAGHLPAVDPTSPLREANLCLHAMGTTLALHTELSVAERMVVEMQRDAFIDPLTGVLNRAGWIHRLAHIDAEVANGDADAAIVMLDLDFLKMVNDTRGHAAGDDLLRLTAETISSVLRSSDSVGRLGGDEFGVVVQNATREVAEGLVQRLNSALCHVDIKISLGMALKSEAGTLKKTMHLADERMYGEKRKKPIPLRHVGGTNGQAFKTGSGQR